MFAAMYSILLRALNGERDLNFLIDSDAGKFVLKIANVETRR